MSREQRLLDRIGGLRADRSPSRYAASAGEDLEALMESIRQHMVHLLNARHGMCETVPDYGLPALSDMIVGRGEHLRRVQDAIRTTIEKYEPRLRRVRVTHHAGEGDDQRLVFRIDAVMVGRSAEHRVWYETSMAPTGELDVSG